MMSEFEPKMAALAGGVLCSMSALGKSFGISITTVLTWVYSRNLIPVRDRPEQDIIFYGQKAAFWYCFGALALTLVASLWGLRAVGKAGGHGKVVDQAVKGADTASDTASITASITSRRPLNLGI